MWRLFIILVFLITSFTFITSAHSRVPTNDLTELLNCPNEAMIEPVKIIEPTLKKEIYFNCRLKEKNEYIELKGDTKTLAMAYKVEDKLYLNSLNVFKNNKLVEFRKYSMDQTLQKWEIFTKDENPFYIYSLNASRLEVFDTETRALKRTCSLDVETNELINIRHHGKFLVATKIKNDQDLSYQYISFHVSESEKPEKFFHQEMKIKSKHALELESCIKSKITPAKISGEITFINQKFLIPEDKALDKEKLLELIKKDGQEITDFFNSLGQEEQL